MAPTAQSLRVPVSSNYYDAASANQDWYGSQQDKSRFIPAIYSKKVLRKFLNETVFQDICNRDYEGEVRSYGWVAKSIGNGRARRAVGRALSRNRIPIVIPCHRVVRKDGDIGGFSSGVPMKRVLLKIEGHVL